MRRLVLLPLLLAACSPYTARPYFPPVTGAPAAELELSRADATETLAAVLRSDTLPVSRVELKDGYLETDWFDAASKRATPARPVGPGVVRIRGWVNPTRSGFSQIIVETVYRPLADPSRPGRELEQQVPLEHPVGKRIQQIVTELHKLYNREEPFTGPTLDGPGSKKDGDEPQPPPAPAPPRR